MEVSTLIAANESRPQFLINLFRELQLISTTDPLRDSLMDAFHELYNRYYDPNNYLGEGRPMPITQSTSNNCQPVNSETQQRTSCNQLNKNNGYTSIERNQTVSIVLVS